MAGRSINSNDIDTQVDKYDPIMLVDELSDTEYYVGWSRNFSDPAQANWRIRRIVKIGTVWRFEYPDGKQDFNYIWDDRLTYTYFT